MRCDASSVRKSQTSPVRGSARWTKPASRRPNERSTDPGKLKQLLRGELDWIVMKAMEKDRTRRYETASSLVAEVTRYLNR